MDDARWVEVFRTMSSGHVSEGGGEEMYWAAKALGKPTKANLLKAAREGVNNQ